MEPLTKKQRIILDYIRRYIKERGYSPTIREIKTHLHFSSPATVHQYLTALEKKGYIKRHKNAARGIELIEEPTPFIKIPVVGYVAAGSPIEIYPEPLEIIKLPEGYFPEGSFAFKVTGLSMIEEGILEGDILIVGKKEFIKNKSIAVVEVEGEGVTVKTIEFDNEKIKLIPSNPYMETRVYPKEKVKLIGILLGLFRKYSSGKP